jgi:hypothetical protein
MGISLRSLTGKDSFTMREVAIDRGFDYLPFSQRELVTPQLGFDRRKEPSEGAPEPDTRPGDNPGEPSDTRPGEQEGLRSTGGVRWANWLDDFAEDSATRLEPENKRQLRKAMVNMLDVDGTDAEIRSVGSGHSHSNAAEPSSSFIDLRRLRNESGTLSHGPGEHGYLAVDTDTSIPGGRTYVRAPEAHYPADAPESHSGPPDGVVPKSYLARLKGGTVLKQLNRDILPTLGETDEPAPGRGLVNMGAWDGQTIAGAVNTGTHGTGLELGAVSDSVRSVEIATVPEARSGVPIVQLFRIEPESGITDREKFEADAGDHEMRLIQDNDVFHSAVVGYGCMGNVYHYTLEVTDSYWVEEVPTVRRLESAYDGFEDPKIATPEEGLLDDLRVEDDTEFDPTTREDVIDFITSDPETGRDTRHLRLFVNLPTTQGKQSRIDGIDDPICLEVRKRKVAAKERPDSWGGTTGDDRWPPERPKDEDKDFGYWAVGPPHPFGRGARKRGNYAKSLRNKFFSNRTSGSPPGGDGTFRKGWWRTVWYIGLRRLRDRKNFPPSPPPDAISTAVAVPVENLAPAVWDVIDQVRSIKQDRPYDPNRSREKDWNVFFSAPLGIRFVAGTHHHLSPEFGEGDDPEPRAMVELPFPIQDGFSRQPRIGNTDYPKLSKGDVRDRVAKPALAQVERKLVEEHGGRPHMGKHFTLGRGEIADLYPRFEGDGGWLQTYRRFNAFGTFNNEFTDQLGISRGEELPGDLTPIPSATAEPEDADGTQGTSGPGGGDEGTSAAGPGLGVLTGLSGLGIAAWLRRRRRADERDESGTDDAEGG